MKYIPSLNGIRAFAVMFAILFHIQVPFFSAGYIGVDIFFVLSGVLITTLLITEIDRTGKLSFSTALQRVYSGQLYGGFAGNLEGTSLPGKFS